jgi:predicted dehydrogenase
MTWKIGVLGLIHDHVWEHVNELAGREDVVLSIADPNVELRDKARDEFGVDRLHDDAATLFARENPDAVLVFTDNASRSSR